MSPTPASIGSAQLPLHHHTQSQCRLRRIQRTCPAHDPSSSASKASSGESRRNPDHGTLSSPAAAALADSDSDSYASSTDSVTYPFPPPGLSKSSSAPSVLPDPVRPLHHSSSHPDTSVWSTFRLESFLGNYCHTTPSLTPDTEFDLSSPNGMTPQPPHPNVYIPKTLNLAPKSALPLSSFSPSSICHVSVNPLMLHRQRQQAFMSHWNRVRQNNRYAPAMPSFFNPVRQNIPACSWNFLRDPACGGDLNGKLNARKGHESIFERALVQLPLTRCRSSCDRIRRGQQNLLGWGIYAWIGPSKHCRYCISDELIKGFLMFRSHETDRQQEKSQRLQEQQDRSVMDADEFDEGTIESDAVLLSYPYRTSSSSTPQDHQDQIQNMPTEPFVNYNEIEPTDHISRAPLKGQNNCSNSDPQNVSAWSAELENRLLASPVIRDLDDFGSEDEDLGGFDDDDLDSYYDSDEEEEEEEEEGDSPCECDTELGCCCPRIIIGEADADDNENQTPQVNILQQVTKDANVDFKQNKSHSDKTTPAICGKVLMSFWEEDDVNCVRVDGCRGVDDFSVGMGVGSGMDMVEEEKWRMRD